MLRIYVFDANLRAVGLHYPVAISIAGNIAVANTIAGVPVGIMEISAASWIG